ncbi:MAG TPA: glycosyltransferase [Actinomycetota bacterium]
MLKEVILVPRRADDGPRDALWEWCRTQKWEREQSHMPIFEGHHNDGLFNRSAAVNKAARLAGDWDVAVIIDSDVFIDPTRLKEAVKLAHKTGKLVYPHDVRKDLTRQGNQRIMAGFNGNWERFVYRRYPDMVSSVVVVPRRLWDEIGGFDESFRGWGYEDTAFAAAAATFGGDIRMPGEVWHLWHPTAKEGRPGTETHMRNSAKGQRYRAAIGNREAIRALQSEGRVERPGSVGIPRILHRVVPEQRNVQADSWWADFEAMHPDWDLMTHRDPLDPAEWPLTAAHWDKVANGAQFADLIRLEALLRFGGVYVDQDVEPLRPLDPLLPLSAFAAWEDPRSVPNAVMGATPDHPAVWACLELMIDRLPGETWKSGPGVLTDVLPGRSDVLLLPPGSFYPYHYKEKERAGEDFRKKQPWAFVAHHWWGSWLEKESVA